MQENFQEARKRLDDRIDEFVPDKQVSEFHPCIHNNIFTYLLKINLPSSILPSKHKNYHLVSYFLFPV